MEKKEQMWIMVKGQYVGEVRPDCFVTGTNSRCFEKLSDEQTARYVEASDSMSKAFKKNADAFKNDSMSRMIADNETRQIYWNVIRQILAEFGVNDPKNPGVSDMYEVKSTMKHLRERAESIHSHLDAGCAISDLYAYDGYEDVFAELRSYLDYAEEKWKHAIAYKDDIGL